MAGPVDHVGLHARLTPDKLAAADLTHGGRWTYRQFDQAIARCVTVLIEDGVGLSDRVAVLAKSRVELIALHFACARIGAIFTPLNWRLSKGELGALIADAEPTVLFGDALAQAAGLAHTPLSELLARMETAAPTETPAYDQERPSLILYTSGTSGRPKGVLLSERNIGGTAASFSILGRVTPQTVVLGEAPMFHIIGLVTNIRPTLRQGGAFLVSDGFIPARTLAWMADPALKVTSYFCVPQMAAALRAEPSFDPKMLRHMTAIFTGGAPHPADSIRAWLADGIPIVDGFGMSEAGTVFGMPIDPAQIALRPGSAGVPSPEMHWRIVDAHERDLPVGEPGELLLKGPSVTSGYSRRPEETAKAFTDDGWFRTGDIARCDEDGFHWLVDRRKDMFISGGENVYPAEIEALLAAHPDIAERAVVGVPDAAWGEVGHLALVARAGAILEPEAVLGELEGRLARFKRPRHVTVIEALPRNGAGKVLKAELRRILTGQ